MCVLFGKFPIICFHVDRKCGNDVLHDYLTQYYSIITWCFSYWPSYRSEACCIGLRRSRMPIQQTEDLNLGQYEKHHVMIPLLINQSNISQDFSLQSLKCLADPDLVVIGLTEIRSICMYFMGNPRLFVFRSTGSATMTY